MKIIETPVGVPVNARRPLSAGEGHAERTIAQLKTDPGLTGLSETRTTGAACIIQTQFAERLVGESCNDLVRIRRRRMPHQLDHGYPEIFSLWNTYSATIGFTYI